MSHNYLCIGYLRVVQCHFFCRRAIEDKYGGVGRSDMKNVYATRMITWSLLNNLPHEQPTAPKLRLFRMSSPPIKTAAS